jgi:hypothetical protein
MPNILTYASIHIANKLSLNDRIRLCLLLFQALQDTSSTLCQSVLPPKLIYMLLLLLLLGLWILRRKPRSANLTIWWIMSLWQFLIFVLNNLQRWFSSTRVISAWELSDMLLLLLVLVFEKFWILRLLVSYWLIGTKFIYDKRTGAALKVWGSWLVMLQLNLSLQIWANWKCCLISNFYKLRNLLLTGDKLSAIR